MRLPAALPFRFARSAPFVITAALFACDTTDRRPTPIEPTRTAASDAAADATNAPAEPAAARNAVVDLPDDVAAADNASASAVVLPPSARAQKQALADLFAVADDYDPDTTVQVNSNETRLQAVKIGQDVGAVDGEARIEVPADLLKVWDFFTQLQLVGDTGNLSAFWEADNGQSAAHEHWYKAPNLNVFQANSIPAQDGVAYTLVVRGRGTLDAVRLLISEGGVGETFDESPWSVLGADKPVLDVTLTLDLDAKRSIAGIDRFEHEKYFRVYASPWGGPWGVLDHVLDHGFRPGRQVFKIGPALEQGYDDEYPNKPEFREDPDRPHHVDPAFFESGWTWPATIPEGIAERFGDLKYALCLDEWPSFNAHSGPGVTNSRGTPEDFAAAAETAGRSVKLVVEQTGLVPAYVEVKNEADVPYEWSYHSAPPTEGPKAGMDGWDLLADFHNQVADGVRAFVPEAKVGGPTSAYPYLSAGDWGLAQRHFKFMDDTKDGLDFYSHHFYEGAGLLFEDRLREGANTYLLGRATAYLDVLQNHMALTDNQKPIVLSEFGTLAGGAEDYQMWQAVRNWSAYLVQFMQRPDELDLTVPFAIPLIWWEPENPDGLFKYDTVDANRDPTKLTANRAGLASGISGSPMTGIRLNKPAWFLDLWDGYRGDLVPVVSDTPHVNVHAAADGKTLWLAVSNLKAQRIAVDLDAALGGRTVSAAEQRRLYLDRGELKYEVHDVADALGRVEVAPEETSVLRLTLDEPVDPTRTLTQTRHYGSRTLMPTGEPQTLTVDGPDAVADAPPASARLRVAVQRKDGFTAPLTVRFNGLELTADLSHSTGVEHFDTHVTLDVPAEAVQRRNTVTLDQPDEGGMLAGAVLMVVSETE